MHTMRFEGQVEVDAPRAAVWRALLDPSVMIRVVPGCRQLEETAPGEFQGRMQLGVGALRGTFNGTLRMSDLKPPEACRLAMQGRGSIGEFAGEGALRLEEQNNATRIAYTADLILRGPLAGLGEGLMQTVARALIAQGIGNLASACRAG